MQHHFTIFADYHQIHVQDDDVAAGDFTEAWTPEAMQKALAETDRGFAIGTVRNMEVPLTVEICESRPALDPGGFDRFNETRIELPSGRLVVLGCTDHFPEAARIAVQPGAYNAIVATKDEDTLSEDGLDGEDAYFVWLWPATDG